MIYARYSSHNQREASIEQQVDMCVNLAQRMGLTVVKTYSDKAISGKTDKRPSFQHMMADATDGLFDYVLAWKSNRIGRNMRDAMNNDAILRDYGVRCVYVEEDFDDTAAGRFALRNMMNVNQFYSEALAEDVRRGMMDNAKNCMVNGRCPYGLRKGKDGKYEIIPEQAEIVREIFSRIKQGWPQRDILDDLNARGIKNRDGNLWKRTTFDKMLSNEQYIGVYKFSGIRIEGGIPAILDRKTFEEVQTILTTKKHPRGRRRDVEDYILSGKLFCGKCGSPMVGICGTSRNGDRHYYYLCQGKHRHECDKKNERKDEIEAKVIDALKRFILDEKTIDRIMAGFEKFIIDLRGMSTLAAMEDELAEANKGIANILKAIESGLPFTEATKDRMIELEERKKELVQDIDEEKRFFQKASPEQVRFSIEYYRDKNLDNREYLRELLNTFVRAIYVFDDHFKIVINNGLGDDIEIPLSDLQEDYSDDDFSGADVRTDATKGHHKKGIAVKAMPLFWYKGNGREGHGSE